MKLKPRYSYEFNQILNLDFDETENIKNFASLLSDKDRFFQFFSIIENNSNFILEKFGYSLPNEIEFFVVRSEKFKSFSEPITIEYSLCPEEMILFLLKEIFKTYCLFRFPDNETRENYINSFIEYLLINININSDIDLIKFCSNLHVESKRLFPDYEFKEIDFKEYSFKQLNEKIYE